MWEAGSASGSSREHSAARRLRALRPPMRKGRSAGAILPFCCGREARRPRVGAYDAAAVFFLAACFLCVCFFLVVFEVAAGAALSAAGAEA